MTPPKVDIQSLDSLYLENLLQLDVNEAAKRFTGSDLALDTKTGTLAKVGKDGATGEATSLEQEAAWVQTIREADTNKDHFVDVDEVKKLLGKLPADQASAIDPNKFLESVQKLMKDRYDPLAKNMKGWKAELTFRPTLDALDLYNKGILSESYRHAGATIALNGLGKTLANVGGFLSFPIRRIGGKTDVLWGDQKAMAAAKAEFDARQASLDKLRDVIQKGVAAGESWAVEGKLDEALKKLDAKDAKVLNEQLAATKIHEILNTTDPKERNQKMAEFAKKDRPSGFLSFFNLSTGNTSGDASFWNYTGGRHNLYFSRTVLRFLGTKASSGDAAADDILHKDSRATLADMNGDPLGGFNNLAAVGLTNIFCLGGKVCQPTEYRDWSDEAYMDAFGRSVDGAFMVFGGNRFLTRLGEAGKLARLKGLYGAEGSVAQVWKASMAESKWNILAGGKWGEAALAAEKEAELLGLAGKSAKDGRFWKLLDKWDAAKKGMKEWIFKGVPLSAEQSALLEKGAKMGGKGLDKLTKGVVLLGIAQYADQKLSAPYNPFEHGLQDMSREAEFERYPDPTKPDPTLYAPKK